MLHFPYSVYIGVVTTTNVIEAYKDVEIAILIGGFWRKEGMERKDVMSKNVSIYKAQALALEQRAAKGCKVTFSDQIRFGIIKHKFEKK